MLLVVRYHHDACVRDQYLPGILAVDRTGYRVPDRLVRSTRRRLVRGRKGFQVCECAATELGRIPKVADWSGQ